MGICENGEFVRKTVPFVVLGDVSFGPIARAGNLSVRNDNGKVSIELYAHW